MVGDVDGGGGTLGLGFLFWVSGERGRAMNNNFFDFLFLKFFSFLFNSFLSF